MQKQSGLNYFSASAAGQAIVYFSQIILRLPACLPACLPAWPGLLERRWHLGLTVKSKWHRATRMGEGGRKGGKKSSRRDRSMTGDVRCQFCSVCSNRPKKLIQS